MEDLRLILTPREAKILEHSRLAEDRSCPRCRMGQLDEWAGVCRVCGYPEFHEDEPCNECEDGDCDKCEYARKLREKIMERERWWREIRRGKL